MTVRPEISNPPTTSQKAFAMAGASGVTGKTTGEIWFDRLAFKGIAGAATFVASVAIAYSGKYGNGMLNRLYDGTASLFQNQFGRSEKAGQNAAMTTLLGVAGTVLILPIRAMVAKKSEIVSAINRRFGKEGEVERGAVNVAHEPKEGWASLIVGRVAAWSIVFAAFTGIGKVRGGAILDSVNKASADVTTTVLGTDPATDLGKHARAHRLGEMIGLDAIATIAASTLLPIISRLYSRVLPSHMPQALAAVSKMESLEQPHVAEPELTEASGARNVRHSDKITPRVASGYTQMTPVSPVGLGIS